MNHAIVLSGGTGTRTGANMPKQYVRVDGHMMVNYALRPLLGSDHIDRVYIVCADEWRDEITEDIREAGLNAGKIAGFAKPGDTRQLSVLNGLRYIIEETRPDTSIASEPGSVSVKTTGNGIVRTADPEDTVLIHDAARPFLTVKLLERCYEALEGYDGVMPVLPMKDTVYLSNDGSNISGLIDRRTVFAGQAPELFRLMPYYEANRKLLPDKILKINGASEPAVMAGMKIAMIPGDEKNIKVTTAQDLREFLKTKEDDT